MPETQETGTLPEVLTLPALQKAIHAWARGKGWWEGERSLGDQFANFHSELSEAWEDYRAGKPLDVIHFEPDGKPCGFPTELADTIIRICDTAERYGIDLEAAIRVKQAYNANRPHRHGGKLA